MFTNRFPHRFHFLAPTLLLLLLTQFSFGLLGADKLSDKTWKQLTKDAQKALEKNDLISANDKLTSALQEAEQFGNADSRLIETLGTLGHVQFQLTKYPEAEAIYRRLLTIDETKYGTNSVEVAGTLLSLGSACQFALKFDQSDEAFKRAESIVEAKYGVFSPGVGMCMRRRAELYHMQKKYEESEVLYKKALELLENPQNKVKFSANGHLTRTVFQPSYTEIANLLNDLGLLYKDERKFAEAESTIKRSLKILEEQFGKNSVNLVGGLTNLALMQSQEDKYEEAEAYARRSLTILRKSIPATHPALLQGKSLLYRILLQQGKPFENEPLLMDK